MNRHAKASSAGSNEGHGKGRGLFRRASAARGSSGSGAPSRSPRRIAAVLTAAAALVLILGVTAASAVAPTVTVNDAGSVEYTSAHVSGKVDPQGESTTYRFQYVDQGTREFELGFGFSEWEFAETGGEGTIEGGAQTVEADLTKLAPNTTYYLRLAAENADGLSEAVAASTFTTKAVATPTVSITAPSSVTSTTAHFTGHIEPNAPAGNPAAFDVNWQFACNPECPGLSGGHITADNSTHTVEADATGLLPGTAYEVTLSASNAGGTASAGPESFATAPVAPQIASPQASPHFTEATLSAQINPGGLQTTYHFEYGPTSSYGQSTPATVIPVGSSPVPVEANIAALSPASEYHYRVVAENSIGAVDSADETFSTLARQATGETCPNEIDRTGLSALLPDCRAYEQVSPVEKNGYETEAGHYGLASPDGNGVMFRTVGPMGEAVRGIQEYTVSHRGLTGWASKPTATVKLERPSTYAKEEQIIPSSDLTKFFFMSIEAYLPETNIIGPEGSGNNIEGTVFGQTALYLAHEDGTIDWVTRPQIPNPQPVPGAIPYSYFESIGASPDLSKAYFWGLPTLLPSDAARAPEHDTSWGMYEYSEGALRSAGTLPDGTESPGGASPAATAYKINGNGSETSPEENANEVSSDGSTLFFMSPDAETHPLTQLYVRRGGHSTLVSHTPSGAPAPHGAQSVIAPVYHGYPSPAYWYVFASPDGSTAYFYSTDALAAGAPNDESLKDYRYDVASNTVTYLPGVDGKVFVTSDNGQRFLFFDGAIKLWDNGVIKTVSEPHGAIQNLSPARSTPSGSAFVFTSNAALPGFPNGRNGIYRYEVASERLSCVSCPGNGAASAGALMAIAEQSNGVGRFQVVPSRGMSENGERIFFQTSDALVPRDTNGVQDVYEWTPSGQYLISSGQSHESSYLLDNSANGDDVFFTTNAALNPADTDGAYDVYDARVGGGFKQPAPPAPCAGAACQGGVSSTPSIQAPGSLAFSGPGNLISAAPGKPKPKPLTRAQKLTKALKACHKVKGKRARASCEKKAHHNYGPPPRKSKAKSRKGGK